MPPRKVKARAIRKNISRFRPLVCSAKMFNRSLIATAEYKISSVPVVDFLGVEKADLLEPACLLFIFVLPLFFPEVLPLCPVFRLLFRSCSRFREDSRL